MTLNKFNTLSAKTKLSDLGICIAKMVLVDKQGVSQVAEEFGISRQTVDNYVNPTKVSDLAKVRTRSMTYRASSALEKLLEKRCTLC